MLETLKGVFASLSAHKVRYLVMGGIASALHGVPRTTFDLDILIDPTHENAARLLQALKAAGMETADPIDAESLLGNEITTFEDFVRIDVQTWTHGISFEPCWDRRRTMAYEGQPLEVLCKEDLIASKRAVGRPIDLEDVRALESN